jgi:hypothetical protein
MCLHYKDQLFGLYGEIITVYSDNLAKLIITYNLWAKCKFNLLLKQTTHIAISVI